MFAETVAALLSSQPLLESFGPGRHVDILKNPAVADDGKRFDTEVHTDAIRLRMVRCF